MRAVVVAVASVIVSGFLSVPAVVHADACVNGTVKRGGSGGDYFLCQGGAWLHVVPTFDPSWVESVDDPHDEFVLGADDTLRPPRD